MTTMQNAARFFDLHTKAVKDGEKFEGRVDRQAEQLAAKARKALARRKGVSAQLIAAQQNDKKQREALVALSQQIHNNRDEPSQQLQDRILKALASPEIPKRRMAEIKVLLNDFRRAADSKTNKTVSSAAKTGDTEVWGEFADGLDDIKKGGDWKDKIGNATRNALINGIENSLGPAGVLIRLARDLKREFGDDAKSYWDRLMLWRKTEKSGTKQVRESRLRKNRRSRVRNAKMMRSISRFADKLKDAGSMTLRGGLRAARGVGTFLGKHKTAAFATALGLGAYATGSMLSSQPHPEKADDGASVMDSLSQSAPVAKSSDSEHKEEAGGSGTTIKDIAKAVNPAILPVQALFLGISSFIGDKWKSWCGNQEDRVDTLAKRFDVVSLKINMTKDTVEERRDQIFDNVRDLLSGAWNTVQKYLPQSVTNGLISIKKMASGAYDTVSKALGGDGTANVQNIQMPAASGAQDGAAAITRGSGADLDGLDAGVRNNLYAMAAEYHRLTGKKVKVNSAKRDSKEQAALYQQNPAKAAKPGYSMHEYGFAIDISDADGTASKLDSMGLLQKYGFVRPLLNASFPEPWHVEPLAIQGLKASIRSGKVVADQRQDQANPPVPDSKTDTEGMAAPTATTSDTKAASVSTQNANSMASMVQKPEPVSTAKSGDQPIAPAAANGNSLAPDATPSARSSTATAPVTEPYQQARSQSDILEVDAPQPAAPNPGVGPLKFSGSKTSVDSIKLYLGDMGMLMMNFGMTGK